MRRSFACGVVAVASLSASACAGSGDPSAASPVLAGVEAVAELGYPRDLFDRGRVNVVVTRPDDVALVVIEHQLRVDGFDPAVPEARRIVVPGRGQRVAVQARFGEVVDCAAVGPPRARLRVRYLLGADRAARDAEIPLADAAVLAGIRDRICTAREVLAANDVTVGPVTLDADSFGVELSIVRRTGRAELAVTSIEGTVVFGVSSSSGPGARTLVPGSRRLVIPLRFVVNRCDPHAVAETTRRQGLTLWIAVDGAPPQPVEIDISSLVDELDVILARCMASGGS